MKTITEFSGFDLKAFLPKLTELTAAQKTPEEIEASFQEIKKYEADKTKWYLHALQLAKEDPAAVKRILVATAAEGEKVPSDYQKKDEHYFLIEFFPGAKKVRVKQNKVFDKKPNRNKKSKPKKFEKPERKKFVLPGSTAPIPKPLEASEAALKAAALALTQATESKTAAPQATPKKPKKERKPITLDPPKGTASIPSPKSATEASSTAHTSAPVATSSEEIQA